jgi:TRAP-type C4-dicarboxylate transport system permease small subunit
MGWLGRLSHRVDRVCRFGAGGFLALMVVLIGIQVVARYLFSEPPGWTEEGARYAMVWSGLLGAAVAFKAGSDPVMMRLQSLEGHPAITWLRAAAVFVFLGPILYFCVFGPGWDLARGFMARSASRNSEAIGVSMLWFSAALPISIVAIMVHVVAGLFPGGEPARQRQDLPLG